MRIIVLGGGIGGLTAAIALRRVGVDVNIYEQAAERRGVGAGIGLAANALRALEVLGLADELQSESVVAVQGGLRRPNGRVLVSIAPDELSRKLGTVAVVHRAELLALLRLHVEPRRLHVGNRCVEVSQDSCEVTAHFDTRESVRGDAIVAADGLRSTVRAQVFGNPVMRYAGYTAWRTVVNASNVEAMMSETWGRGCRFGIVPMTRGRVYWFAVKNAPEGQQDPSIGAKAGLAELFRGWHHPIGELIAASREGEILRHDIYDIDPLPRFSQGRVALLGDAAHPMTPNLGQRGCQAIEDSVVLAAALNSSRQIEPALLEYERRRLARAQNVLLWSRWIGIIAQIENPLLCSLRDLCMRAMPKGLGLGWMRELLGAEILSPEEQALLNPELR